MGSSLQRCRPNALHAASFGVAATRSPCPPPASRPNRAAQGVSGPNVKVADVADIALSATHFPGGPGWRHLLFAEVGTSCVPWLPGARGVVRSGSVAAKNMIVPED